MAKKTNKTSHVMDLLTNGASPETGEAADEAVTSGQEKKSDIQSHTVTPAKVTVVDEGSINDRVSQEILGKLTEELAQEVLQEGGSSSLTEEALSDAPKASESDSTPVVEESAVQAEKEALQAQEEAPQPAPAAREEAAQSTPAVPEEAPQPAPGAQEEVSRSAPADQEAPIPETPKKEPHPIIPESHFGSHTQNREYRFVNVMEQLLMRQDLDAVLKQHNVCTCPRCMSDVCALALTGLPSKYVVTSKDSISPLLSYYENKYRIPVLTELMKACNKVRENPRHKK